MWGVPAVRFDYSRVRAIRDGGMSTGTTRRDIASDTTGPALPGMFARYKGLVEEHLSRSVPSPDDAELYTLLLYHLGRADRYGRPAEFPIAQGKGLRSTLCLFACEALEGDLSQALPAAVALDLVHYFSLIHDDIQDGDLERHHQPTVWHLWGVPKALVAGNAMQSLGDLALLSASQLAVSPETRLKVSQLLTESSLEMIQGQCLDLEFEASTSISTSDYLQMIACKTGALIRSGPEIGALLAADDPASSRAFSRFGSYLGRVFQVRDDSLGIWGDEATTGKPVGNDIRRRKKTFPVVFALEQATGQARHDLLRIYSQDNLDDDDVAKVLAVLDEVGAPEYSQQLIQESGDQAIQALEEMPLASWAKAEAGELVDFLARREY